MRGKTSAILPAAIAALLLVLLGTPCHTWVPPEPEDLDGIPLLQVQQGAYTPPFELLQGESHDHHINITFDEGESFDVNLVLDVISGDADLHVLGPIADSDGVPAMNEPPVDVSTVLLALDPSVCVCANSTCPKSLTLVPVCLFPQRKSVHYTGSEIVFLSRDDIQAAGMGIYRITIKGFKADNEYALTIEYTSTERRPSPEEQQVLENIYRTCCYADACLDLAPYVEASGYGAVENFCHAPYQSCDKDGHILALRLPGQELDCMLPESVGNLTYLQRLDLEDNYIYGEVGSLFSTLEDVPLHSLHMGLNYLKGKLPCLPTEADVPLSGLAYIDLGANGIGNEIEACFFTPALEIVNLRGNFLTGLFPKSLPSSTKMLHLDLSWQHEEDHLTGELPDFTVWPNLEHLNVARNRINGSFPVLPDSLVVLRLHENRIDGEMPSSLGQFPRLMMLDVANNRLSGPLPETLPDTLVSLEMTENQFTGPIPGMEWFGHYEGPRGLQELRLGGNRLTGLIPPELGLLGELWVLDLRNNLLEGSMEIFVEGIDDGNKLVNLNLAGNGITGTIPEGISKLHSFQDDYEPPPFWEGQKAAVFDISNNKLQGQIPAALLKAAAEEDRELKFEISGNSLECPQEYLGIFGGHESELEAAGGLRGTTCIDRSGNMVLLSEDQAKQRPGNLIWDDQWQEWFPDPDYESGGYDYTDYDYSEEEFTDTNDWFLLGTGPYTPPFELLQGDTHDHHINITFDEGESFDVNLILDVISGDADLHVLGPIADSDGNLLSSFPEMDVSATQD